MTEGKGLLEHRGYNCPAVTISENHFHHPNLHGSQSLSPDVNQTTIYKRQKENTSCMTRVEDFIGCPRTTLSMCIFNYGPVYLLEAVVAECMDSNPAQCTQIPIHSIPPNLLVFQPCIKKIHTFHFPMQWYRMIYSRLTSLPKIADLTQSTITSRRLRVLKHIFT